jgi:hypothetical protein
MKTETQEQEKLKAAAAIYEKAIAGDEIEPQKCPLDEVAAAYIATLRVENYADLGYEFGGYKIGAIYSYILRVLNDSINRLNNPQECITNAIFAEKVGK